MAAPRLIVVEKSTHWATALRTALGNDEGRVLETRSLAACKAALLESPCSLLAIETTPINVVPVVEFVASLGTSFPLARAVALLPPEPADLELLLREAGMIDVLASLLDVERLARQAERHFAAVPMEQQSAHELAYERMPWPAYTSNKN